jgi:shikimate kinase
VAGTLAGEGDGGLTPGDAKRVYLVGFMGSGKTTVGRRLAERLGVPFVDLDAAYEAMAGETVRSTFETRGEAFFRERETELLKGTGAFPAAVVALGGGTIAFPENLAFVKRHGVSVFLDVPFDVLAERLAGKSADRPLFRTPAEARLLLEARLPFYRMADWAVSVNGEMTVDEVAARVEAVLRPSAEEAGREG